jgi:hypothetical protein
MLNFLRFQTRVLHCGQRPFSKLVSADTLALGIANKELSLDMMQKAFVDRFNLHLGRRGVKRRCFLFANPSTGLAMLSNDDDVGGKKTTARVAAVLQYITACLLEESSKRAQQKLGPRDNVGKPNDTIHISQIEVY